LAQQRFTTPVAVHLFLTRNDQILLLRRFNTGYEDGNYSVIAGHLDGNETVIAAMQREAREEGDIEIAASDLHIVQVMHRLASDREYIDYFLTCSTWSGELTNLEPDKCDELRWTSINNLPINVVPYVSAAIQHWQSGIPFTCHGFTGQSEI
jgi:8-oxo-dGTP diphosphatase